MLRSLAVVFIITTSAFGQTIIQDGDHETNLQILDDGLLMTGGQVDQALFWGNGPYEIEGGSIGPITLESGDVYFSGGTPTRVVRSERHGGGQITRIEFDGYYFRYFDQGLRARNTYLVEGWLSDGSFIHMDIINNVEYDTSSLPTIFNIVPSIPPEGDVDGNWAVDLEDLNIIRNSFGDPYTLDDLNATRNNFGVGAFTLDLNSANVHEVFTNPVPEPAAFKIVFMIVGSMVLIYFFRGDS